MTADTDSPEAASDAPLGVSGGAPALVILGALEPAEVGGSQPDPLPAHADPPEGAHEGPSVAPPLVLIGWGEENSEDLRRTLLAEALSADPTGVVNQIRLMNWLISS